MAINNSEIKEADNMVPQTFNLLCPIKTTAELETVNPLEYGMPAEFNFLPGDRRFTDDFDIPKEGIKLIQNQIVSPSNSASKHHQPLNQMPPASDLTFLSKPLPQLDSILGKHRPHPDLGQSV